MVKTIAIYLPQFHPIPENDAWWGKGFTEWTNVTKAKPLYDGHYQPHLPADLGFYDLRLEEARLAQEALAKEYGIYGFCYYHYWFNGKRMLNEPVDRKLKNPKEDLPFMLCWANENWTRTWDGMEHNILLKQDYSPADDLDHIRALLPYLQDPRYIRVSGKPILAIYRSSLLPNPANTIKIWRDEAAKHGIELYLCRLENFGHYGKLHLDAGFDAGIEFQPFTDIFDQYKIHYLKKMIKNEFVLRLKLKICQLLKKNKAYKQLLMQYQQTINKQIDYNDYVDYVIANYKFDQDYVKYPCLNPSWDNTARKGINSFILHDANPEKFGEWVDFVNSNYKPASAEENIIFINAWNEWGEGNHLEPCQKWGHSYLESIKKLSK